jgi:hypothetical protein
VRVYPFAQTPLGLMRKVKAGRRPAFVKEASVLACREERDAHQKSI